MKDRVHGTRATYWKGCRCDECRAANAAYYREYRQRNRTAVNAKRRENRVTDPDRYRAVEKAWRDANIEQVRETKRESYYRSHEANKAKLRDRSRARGERWMEAKITLIAHLGGACVDCGNTDPRVLQFDHVDIAAKTSGLPDLVRRRGMDSPLVWAEAAICELRCANCHAIKTFVNGDYLAGKRRQHGVA